MKIKLLGGVMMALLACASCAQKEELSKKDLNSASDSLSYAIGINMATNFQKQSLDDVDVDIIRQAMVDVKNGTAVMDAEGADAFMRQELQARADKKTAMNQEIGEKWLADNAKKDGVKVTASGLQYKVIKEGNGISPDVNDEVTCHYKGTLITGEVFDSSYDRGTPATFALNRVIKGWTEGLQLMKTGATYEFYIPQELAYGANPRPGGLIEPYMALVFQVELIEVNVKE